MWFDGLQAECIVGKTQVFSRDKRLTQCIHTHSVLLTSYLFEGNRFPTTVLCAAGRDTVDHSVGKVCVYFANNMQEKLRIKWHIIFKIHQYAIIITSSAFSRQVWVRWDMPLTLFLYLIANIGSCKWQFEFCLVYYYYISSIIALSNQHLIFILFSIVDGVVFQKYMQCFAVDYVLSYLSQI